MLTVSIQDEVLADTPADTTGETPADTPAWMDTEDTACHLLDEDNDIEDENTSGDGGIKVACWITK